MVLALHELATNAVKGALSVEHGRADLTWSVAKNAEEAIRR